jgi:hypothetical protein
MVIILTPQLEAALSEQARRRASPRRSWHLTPCVTGSAVAGRPHFSEMSILLSPECTS